MAEFDKEWMRKWEARVNADKVMKVIGRFFDADIYLEFGDIPYIITVRKGSIEDIIDKEHISIENSWDFALRAPLDSWKRFIQPIPPPMYNDIWAMAHPLHGRLKMEGNIKAIWQNLRALTWMLSLMREVK